MRLVEEVVTERLRVRVTVADTERVRDTEVVRERDTVGERVRDTEVVRERVTVGERVRDTEVVRERVWGRRCPSRRPGRRARR